MNSHRVSLEALQERIAKLEVQNRWFKRCGVAALAGGALVAIMAQSPSAIRKTIDTNEITIRDTHGNVRARIGVDATNDTAEMWLQTAKGDEGTSLSQNGILMKQDGVARTIIGESSIKLTNSKGVPNVTLTAVDDAERDLFIEGSNGYLQYLPGHALEIADSDGYEASMGSAEIRGQGAQTATQTNAASFVLFDPDKKVLWKAP